MIISLLAFLFITNVTQCNLHIATIATISKEHIVKHVNIDRRKAHTSRFGASGKREKHGLLHFCSFVFPSLLFLQEMYM